MHPETGQPEYGGAEPWERWRKLLFGTNEDSPGIWETNRSGKSIESAVDEIDAWLYSRAADHNTELGIRQCQDSLQYVNHAVSEYG